MACDIAMVQRIAADHALYKERKKRRVLLALLIVALITLAGSNVWWAYGPVKGAQALKVGRPCMIEGYICATPTKKNPEVNGCD